MSAVVSPTSLEGVVAALAADPAAQIVAGGTDFMVEVNFDHRRPDSVVSLHRVASLREWSDDPDALRIGSGVTCATLERSPFTALVPVLSQAARTVGSPQIRNAATIGGNLGTASPAGDLLPGLSALDATVIVAGPGGERSMSIHDFLVGPKRNALEPGELIVGVSAPVLPGRQEFLKVGTRNAMVISVANLAMVHAGDRVNVALGSVGPTVLRARAAESWFVERGLDPDAIDEFARGVAAEARPIDDHRSSAVYRRHAIEVCARRAARRILE
jgi:CO/xanthine dehydrogenase FAD-binding subunit